MRYHLATDEQLLNIISHDKGCLPSHLRGLAEEMIKRNLWDGIICYAGKKAFQNLNYVVRNILRITHDELIHIGHIEIIKQLEKYKPNMRTFKTYIFMCLIGKFKKMLRDAHALKQEINNQAFDVDGLEEKVQTKIFCSPVNVERYVINKLTLESVWGVLREVEKKAILLEQEGYSQYEIAEIIGVRKTHGNTLLKRAYAKLRKELKHELEEVV